MTPAPIHVVHVFAGEVEGGLQKHALDLTGAQLAAGMRVSVIAPPVLLGALDDRIGCRELRLFRGRRDPRSLLHLGRELKQIAPDIVHTHATKATAMVATLRGFRLAPPAPFVATLHSVKRALGPYTRADRVIAVSPSAAAQITGPPVDVVCNGVAPPEPWRGPLPRTRPDAPLVYAVGRLVRVKGFDRLVERWTPDDPELWIAGDGPERPALERSIHERGLERNVHLLGNVPGAAALMEHADLVVIPSRREGFSYVMAEGLLARRLVVATRVPGPMDVMPDELTTPADDADALVARCREALADPDRFTRLIEPAWELAARELTLEAMGERTENAYRKAIASQTA